MYKSLIRIRVKRDIRALHRSDATLLLRCAASDAELSFPGDNSLSRQFRAVLEGPSASVTHRGRAGLDAFAQEFVARDSLARSVSRGRDAGDDLRHDRVRRTQTIGGTMDRTSMVTDGALAGIVIGTWRIDPAHTSVTFSVRHLMSKVRGQFSDVGGQIVIGQALASCSAEASIATASVGTGTQMRDDDLRSARFLDSARFPSMGFASAEITGDDTRFTLVGDLTIRDVTRRVAIEGEFLGLDETGLQGEPRIGFSGRTTLRRSGFNVGDSPVEGSKVVIGDTVTVELDIEAFLEQ